MLTSVAVATASKDFKDKDPEVVTVTGVDLSELQNGTMIEHYKKYGDITDFAAVSLGPPGKAEGVVKLKYASAKSAQLARNDKWLTSKTKHQDSKGKADDKGVSRKGPIDERPQLEKASDTAPSTLDQDDDKGKETVVGKEELSPKEPVSELKTREDEAMEKSLGSSISSDLLQQAQELSLTLDQLQLVDSDDNVGEGTDSGLVGDAGSLRAEATATANSESFSETQAASDAPGCCETVAPPPSADLRAR